MKIKVSTAVGPALDWMVAKCEGWAYDDVRNAALPDRRKKYSTNWNQGGPIIERERIIVFPRARKPEWFAEMTERYYGPTPLIAAMRCYVVSRLGEEVEVPEELI